MVTMETVNQSSLIGVTMETLGQPNLAIRTANQLDLTTVTKETINQHNCMVITIKNKMDPVSSWSLSIIRTVDKLSHHGHHGNWMNSASSLSPVELAGKLQGISSQR